MNNKLKKLFATAFNYIAWFAVGIAYGAFIFSDDDLITISVLGFFILYLSILGQTIIHELGHLVFGLLTGYKFSSFRIMNIALVKQNGKLKLKSYSLAGTGGQCLMTPPDAPECEMPYVLYNLGGVLLNLIFSAVFFALYFTAPRHGIASDAFFLFGAVGIVFVLTNGIPMSTGYVDNDGMNIISIGKDDRAMHAYILQLKICEAISNGARLKQLPDEWFYIKTSDDMKNAMMAQISVYACNRLMDNHSFDEAKNAIESLLLEDTAVEGVNRHMLNCDRLYCELIGSGNESVICDIMLDKKFVGFMRQMRNNPSVLRTQYACEMLYNKNNKKAAKIKKQFNKLASRYPFEGDIALEKELISIVDGICNSCEYNNIAN